MSGDRSVEVVRRIAAPPEIVYAFFTDAERWSRWQGNGASLDPRPGGQLRIAMGTDPDAGAIGAFVALEPGRRIVFTWGWAKAPFGDVPPGSTLVEIDLTPDGDGTLLRLVHSRLTAEMTDQHLQGWNRYLERLASAAAGLDPGPEPSLAIG
jgi:uncharacterized protein YndB with AHSA1/START domain